MKLGLIIKFFLGNKALRRTIYEVIDYLVKRHKLKNDSEGLTPEDRKILGKEKADIAQAFINIIKW